MPEQTWTTIWLGLLGACVVIFGCGIAYWYFAHDLNRWWFASAYVAGVVLVETVKAFRKESRKRKAARRG